MTTDEAARLVGLTARAIRQWIDAGYIRVFVLQTANGTKVGQFVTKRDVDRYALHHRPRAGRPKNE